MTTEPAMNIAQERQLDWLLAEVLSGASVHRSQSRSMRGVARSGQRWLAAALVAFAVTAAFGVALLQRTESLPRTAQDPAPAIEWYEAHGPASIDSIPKDVVNLRCFDFDDDALVQIPHFGKLERLDLSGMDVNEQGYAVSLHITDKGLAALSGVPNLRWLSLAGCHDVKGTSFAVLEAMPMLEHLDLTYSGVESPAVERLNHLASLRELSLSRCMNFHGRSLAEVAKIPGLRRLELRGCVTLSAADVVPLAKLSELRWLDLRDCQGRFRGQTASGFSAGGEEPPPPPAQDGIGITDASVAGLAGLKLEALLLGGSESLTDAIGETLAKMPALRVLDLSNLPKTTGALLAQVPPQLESLALDLNPQFDAAALRRLPPLPSLREFGLSGLIPIDDGGLRAALANRSLRVLRLGGAPLRGKGDPSGPFTPPPLTSAAAAIVAEQRELESLDVSYSAWLDDQAMRQLAALPNLRELDLTACPALRATQLAPFAKSRTLEKVKLVWCRVLDATAVAALAGAPLRELDLYGTNLKPDDIREIAKAWPGCVIKMPKGQRYRVP